MILRVVPATVKAVVPWINARHRHLKRLKGGLLACAISRGEPHEWCGAGVVANPAQVWQGTGRCVISRVCVVEGVQNGCSMIYGALAGAVRSLGYVEVWTYTLPEEPGTSLRAAGFVDMGMSAGGEHDREGRPRLPAERSDQKRRWMRRLSGTDPWPRPDEIAPPLAVALPLFASTLESQPGGLPWNRSQ